MNYEEMTFEKILERMLEKVPNNMDKREGSIIYDALAPAAAELAVLYIELQVILNESYANTATRDYLVLRAMERGLSPHEATNAILEATFTPSTLEIPIGSRFNNEDLNYEVISKISDGKYQVKCESKGKIGNKASGTLTPIDYIENLETASLTSILIPGEDEEETEELRNRYFNSFASSAFGGNKADYIEKTNAINGVGATKVTSVWNGPGTVKLTILDSNYDKATNTLINSVQNTVDPTQISDGMGIAPIGHVVTVDTAIEVPITITTSLTLETNTTFASIKTQIEEAIEAYLLSIRKTWANNDEQLVRISQIENKILSITGVLDIANTKINNSTSNLTLTKYQIPVFESISVI